MALEKEDLGALSPDALTPAATEAKVEAVAQTKAAMPFGKCFVSALLAGAFIGFGGMYFMVFLGDPTLPFGVQRVVGGLVLLPGTRARPLLWRRTLHREHSHALWEGIKTGYLGRRAAELGYRLAG